MQAMKFFSSDSEERRVLEYDVIESVIKLYLAMSLNVWKPVQLQIKISDDLEKIVLYLFNNLLNLNTRFLCVAFAFTKTVVYEEKQRQHLKIRK